MIVRDEERYMEECLRSIMPVADEIVIGDTGSRDRTPEIAQDLGARLFSIPWADDFSAARNQVLDKARGTWILSIDADEKLRSTSRLRLHSFLQDSDKIAFYALMHPMSGWTPMWVLRLFRNHPQIRFSGVFHETLQEGLRDVLAADEMQVGYADLVIDHLGYDHNQEEKHTRNLPLLLKAIDQDPERDYVWVHLGQVYEALDQHDLAEKAWTRAIESARKKEGGYLYAYVYFLEWKARHGLPIGGLLEEAMGRFPENPYLYWLRGRLLMDQDRWSEAIPFFERLLVWGERQDFNRRFTYPSHIFDVSASDSLAVCHFRLGNYRESGRYFQLARRFAPDGAGYKVKEQLCEALARAGSAG